MLMCASKANDEQPTQQYVVAAAAGGVSLVGIHYEYEYYIPGSRDSYTIVQVPSSIANRATRS